MTQVTRHGFSAAVRLWIVLFFAGGLETSKSLRVRGFFGLVRVNAYVWMGRPFWCEILCLGTNSLFQRRSICTFHFWPFLNLRELESRTLATVAKMLIACISRDHKLALLVVAASLCL